MCCYRSSIYEKELLDLLQQNPITAWKIIGWSNRPLLGDTRFIYTEGWNEARDTNNQRLTRESYPEYDAHNPLGFHVYLQRRATCYSDQCIEVLCHLEDFICSDRYEAVFRRINIVSPLKKQLYHV